MDFQLIGGRGDKLITTSDKYFYDTNSSSVLLFIDTENNLLIDIDNIKINNYLINQININRSSIKSFIGDYFSIEIKSNILHFEKIIFLYIEGELHVSDKFAALKKDVQLIYKKTILKFAKDNNIKIQKKNWLKCWKT